MNRPNIFRKFVGIALTCIVLFPFVNLANAQLSQQAPAIAVSAVVPPKQTDYQFAFASDGQTNVPQNTTLDYTITYGARASAVVSSTTTIVANFSDDQAPGGSDVLDYVIGSASTAYGGIVPVVDLTNRTITWTLPNFPAGTTDQTVTFQLRTNENYTGPALVNFTTKTSMSNEYVTMPDQTITQTYQFNDILITPTPTPTLTPTPTMTPIPTDIPTPTPTNGIAPTGLPGPTATPNPQPTTTSQPTPLPTTTQQPANAFTITDVAFNALSQSAATIAVTTSRPANEQIRFGTSPTALQQTVQSNQLQMTNLLQLNNLLPSTKYYFQIIATDAAGNTIKSELFTFTTAEKSQPSIPSNTSVVITSGGNVVIASILTPNTPAPFGALTTNTDYQLTYSFDSDPSLISVNVVVRNSDGIDRIVHMNQKDARTYIANLRSGGSGIYEIVVRTTDRNGNITEKTVARLKATNRLTVLEKGSAIPIGDARIYLSVFNARTKRFEPLNDISFGWLKNPSFTNTLGQLEAILPVGRYRADVSAFGYDSASVDFTIGEAAGQDFPTVYLQKDFFNMTALFHYIQDWFIDMYNGIRTVSLSLASSIRFYNSVAAGSMLAFILLSFLLFKIRTGIHPKQLAPFLLLNLFSLMHKHEKYLRGIILAKDDTPINQVRIEIMDIKSNTVLAHTVSNNNGRFAIANTFKQPFIKLRLTRDGLQEMEMIVATDTKKEIKIHMIHAKQQQTPLLIMGIEQLAGSFFEVALIVSLVAELFFLPAFGLIKTLPFLALSLCNLLLWIFYMRERRQVL